ncbi:Gfo/Idh/MocA family oxidoreductase [Prochlorococcus sp. MIT 1300]|uniref:Gfo/Idh/MocA family protein n=1 Tax=Prochlorococcus sp. MIT 1300 TaxID=3096218 RepID=UPI002A757873|nr:Gfo/Idh/MocA family oxidoreductase [Prochlorococcus sp. MIT 1300]
MNAGTQASIGVAIAGIGFGEAVHLPALRATNTLEPVCLWHPIKERLIDPCQKYNLPGENDWQKLLANSKVEAIVLATPPAPRFELAKKALEAGKHLLLEKPVALNFNQVIELQKIALAKGLSVAVDFEYRAVPLFMQAKRMLDQGAVGEPWLVKLDWLMSSRANPDRPWNWYSQRDQGGGVLGALGTHAFDLLHWLFGPTIQVGSHCSTSIKMRKDPNDGIPKKVTSEDLVLAQLMIAGTHQNAEIPAQVTLSAVTRQGRGFWLEIYGSDGTLLLGSNNQKDYVHGFSLLHSNPGEPLISISPDSDLAFSRTWSDGRIAPVRRLQDWWGESIQSGIPMIPGLVEGAASQKVCDQILESAASGQKIFLR